MKKSTIVLVLIAVAFGAFVYSYEFKRKPSAETAEGGAEKPAFTFAASDIASIRLTQSGQTVAAARQNGEWRITQPVESRADQMAVNSIADGLAGARVRRNLKVTPDQLKTFGLSEPAVTLEVKLKDSTEHRLRLGDKDYSGLSAYALLDGSPDVAMLPATLLTSTDKSLADLRDMSVLGVSSWDVVEFDLKNHSGEIQALKKDADWHIEKPRAVATDGNAITQFLGRITAGRIAKVVSESADDLARYGLAKPAISLEVKLQTGGERTLELGKQSGGQYFARDTSRKMIFQVDQGLGQKLETTLFDLRDKSVARFEPDQLARVEIRNRYQTLVAVRDSEGKWKVDKPKDQKGKTVDASRFLEALQNLRATKIWDSPPGDLAARLVKPVVEARLTDKNGHNTKISVLAEAAGHVYVRNSASTAFYEVGKQTLDDLNFKVADILE